MNGEPAQDVATPQASADEDAASENNFVPAELTVVEPTAVVQPPPEVVTDREAAAETANPRAPANHLREPQRGVRGIGAPEGEAAPPEPPAARRVARYAIQVTPFEREPLGVLQAPSPYIFNNAKLRDMLRGEAPATFTEVIIQPLFMQFLMFFGRREWNEGLSWEDADDVSTNLSTGPRHWEGRHMELVAEPILIGQARRAAAAAVSSQVALDRVQRRAFAANRAGRYPPADLDSDDDQLVGAGLPEDLGIGLADPAGSEGPVPLGRELPAARAPPRRRGRPRRAPPREPAAAPPAAPEGRNAPPAPPPSERGYQSDASGMSRASRRSRQDPVQNIRVDIGGKPSIPTLKHVGEDYAGNFLVWKTMVETSAIDTPERLLRDAIRRSLMEFPGVSEAIAAPTIPGCDTICRRILRDRQ